ncbi:hypothetical protein ACLOAV_009627 [Pseudogymnoascus australis]
MRDSGVAGHQLLTNPPNESSQYPELVFPRGFQLECLHGRHRIQAGREFLSPRDKWWTVDLYLSDLNTDLKTCLVEEYSNEEKPSDGEMYRKIRQYHFQRNYSFETRWKARLQGNRAKNLGTLLGNVELTEAFDALLDIPGLWDGMMITTLHTVMAMDCHRVRSGSDANNELLNYLGHIKKVWSDLVGGDKTAMGKIDQATVKFLELRAPMASTADARLLRSRLRGGEVFGAFSDHERDAIWSRLQVVDGLVPSLFTFFRDIQYLALCADCVKRLIRLSPEQDVSDALERRFTGVNQVEGQVKVQVTENSFVYWRGSLENRIDLGCRQINVYAMRHYPDMPREGVREDRVKKATAEADRAVLRLYADLAGQLGFDSSEIVALKQYPDARAMPADYSPSRPLLVTSGPGVPKAQRCGIPRCRAYEEDRGSLFINHLHDGRQEQGEGITSFFVRRSVYFAFFGRPTNMPATGRGSASLSPLGSPSRGPSPDFSQPPRPGTSESHGTGEHMEGDMDLILSYYAQESGASQARGEAEDAGQSRGQAGNRAEQERKTEQERLALEAQERERRRGKRLDQTRRARAKQERERKEQERQEHERLAQERSDLLRIEQERQAAQEQMEQERMEQERMEQERLEQMEHEKVQISFIIKEGVVWRDLPPLTVQSGDTSEVEYFIEEYMRKNIQPFNTRLYALAPHECFNEVTNDRTHTILLIAQDELVIDDEMLESAAKLHGDAMKRVLGLKRVATYDIARIDQPRKRLMV